MTSIDLAEPNACIANIGGVAQGLAQSGYKVTILAPTPSTNQLAFDFATIGVDVRLSPSTRRFGLTNTFAFVLMLPALWAAQHSDRISIFYIRYSPLSLLAASFLKLFGRAFVVSEHNGWLATEAAQHGYSNWLCRLGGATQRIDAKLADIVRVVSSDIADKLVKQGIPRNKIFVSENATMTGRLRPIDRATAMERSGLDPNRVWAGFMGTLNKWQGVELALKAFAKLKDRCPQLSFVIAGDGPAKLELEALASRLQVSDRTRFLGWIMLDQANDVMNSFDIALAPFPGSRPIGSPVKLRDYAAAGRAIIASDFPAIRRIASTDWVTLYRCDDVDDLADKIQQLVEDPALRGRMATRSREVAEAQFDWNPVIADIVKHLPPR